MHYDSITDTYLTNDEAETLYGKDTSWFSCEQSFSQFLGTYLWVWFVGALFYALLPNGPVVDAIEGLLNSIIFMFLFYYSLFRIITMD